MENSGQQYGILIPTPCNMRTEQMVRKNWKPSFFQSHQMPSGLENIVILFSCLWSDLQSNCGLLLMDFRSFCCYFFEKRSCHAKRRDRFIWGKELSFVRWFGTTEQERLISTASYSMKCAISGFFYPETAENIGLITRFFKLKVTCLKYFFQEKCRELQKQIAFLQDTYF